MGPSQSGGEYPVDRIAVTLGGTTGTTEASFTTGRFSFDEHTLRQIIRDFRELASSYRVSLFAFRRMQQIDGPGLDIVSHFYAFAATVSRESYMAYLERGCEFCTTQADRLQTALDTYLAMDAAGEDRMNRTHPDEPGPRAGI